MGLPSAMPQMNLSWRPALERGVCSVLQLLSPLVVAPAGHGKRRLRTGQGRSVEALCVVVHAGQAPDLQARAAWPGPFVRSVLQHCPEACIINV